MTTDVAVPISRLGDALESTEKLLAKEGILGPIVAHAGREEEKLH